VQSHRLRAYNVRGDFSWDDNALDSLKEFFERSNVSNVVFPFRTGRKTSADLVPMRHFESASETNVSFVPKNSAKTIAPDFGNEL